MTVLGTLTLPVEAAKVAELGRAVRWRSPGVPPTFTVVSARYAPPGRSANELIIAAAGLAQSRVLLGSMSWSYRRPLQTGDQLTGSVRLTGCRTATSRSGQELRIATGQTDWTDTAGEPVVTVGVSLVEPARPAGPAAQPPAPRPAAGDGVLLTLSRADIVRYAGASGDVNPVHRDPAAARALGYPDVFAMGLLPAGILASAAAETCGRLRALAARFRGLIWPGVPYQVHSGQAGGPELSWSLRDPRGAAVLELTAAGGARS